MLTAGQFSAANGLHFHGLPNSARRHLAIEPINDLFSMLLAKTNIHYSDVESPSIGLLIIGCLLMLCCSNQSIRTDKTMAQLLDVFVFTLFTDVDECDAMTRNCNCSCSNTLGSIDCKCNARYSLNPDNSACSFGLHKSLLLSKNLARVWAGYKSLSNAVEQERSVFWYCCTNMGTKEI